jgi:dephospho-CoA kinase
MKRIGLTGSIGMGKSATADLFKEIGIPVFDSDACVHTLYARGGAAVAPVGAAFPDVVKAGAVDRGRLAAHLRDDPSGFERLEAIVHPLVADARQAFVDQARLKASDLVVFDIPLLFETGGDAEVDVVLVVSAPDNVRRERVLRREGMTEAKLDSIVARQMPDSDKRARADFIIETSGGIDDARRQVTDLVDELRKNVE